MADLWTERKSLLDLPDGEALAAVLAVRLRRREQRASYATKKRAERAGTVKAVEKTSKLLAKLSLEELKLLLEKARDTTGSLGDSDEEEATDGGDGE